jgi:hypothetical protein
MEMDRPSTDRPQLLATIPEIPVDPNRSLAIVRGPDTGLLDKRKLQEVRHLRGNLTHSGFLADN